MKNIKMHIIGLLMLILTVSFVSVVFINPPNNIEAFTNLEPGTYPLSEDKPILVNDYPEKKNPGVSNLGSQQLAEYYPIFPANSDKTNNIRYWNTPNNGLCTPGIMCGGLYNSKNIQIPPSPIPPKWNDGTRVNFYDSRD
jgi:hypothetical protein